MTIDQAQSIIHWFVIAIAALAIVFFIHWWRSKR